MPSYTKLLLHFDEEEFINSGTSGQPNLITSVTRVATPRKRHFGYSASFNGGYIRFPYNGNHQPGTGSWTLDFWIYATSTTKAQSANTIMGCGNVNNNFWIIDYLGTNDKLRLYTTSGINTQSGVVGLETGVWTHLAIERSPPYTRFYKNGEYFSNVNDGGYFNNPNQVLWVGYGSFGGGPFRGYMTELRFSKGILRYNTQNFTPPKFPYLTTPKNIIISPNISMQGVKFYTDNIPYGS